MLYLEMDFSVITVKVTDVNSADINNLEQVIVKVERVLESISKGNMYVTITISIECNPSQYYPQYH